jgi:hypothetical protein
LGTEHILFVVLQQAMGARSGRSKRLEVTMTASLQEIQLKRGNTLKKIKVEGKVDEGREVIIRYEAANLKWIKWKGFESHMVIWTKIYKRI